MAKLSLLATFLAALTAISSVSAAIPADQHPKRELFERSHKAARLNNRAKSGSNYPPILEIPDPKLLPQAWKDALQAAVDAGKVPNIPVSTLDADGNPSYPKGTDPAQVGSWTLAKTIGPNDISEAPKGVWAVGFDDGPTDESPPLYEYLQSQNQAATHFLIGSNIVSYPNEFLKANETGGQLAVHTWSHKLQTANTNEQVLGDIGWTMQIIYDRTGRIPNLWRPPQGDVDNRVRAIAEEVLGLRTVLWRADANDWCLDDDFKTECPADNKIGQSYKSVTNYVDKFIDGKKDPGVIMLEHEIHKPSIALFKKYYPTLKGKGWDPRAVGEFDDVGGFYANAKDNVSPPTSQSEIVKAASASAASSSSSSSASASTGASGSSSGSGMSTSSNSGSSNSSSSAKSTGTVSPSNANTSGAQTTKSSVTLAAAGGFGMLVALVL